VDYSCKYGLGYILNNGAAGAFFNDSSKIILDMNEEYFTEPQPQPQKLNHLLVFFII